MPKLNLLEKIKNVIDAYHVSCKLHADELRKIIEPYKSLEYLTQMRQRYTDAGLCDLVDESRSEVLTSWKETDKLFNQKLKLLIEEAKAELSAPTTRTADHAARVANALSFLQIQGSDLTDDVAHAILKDFEDDAEQMALFAQVVENQVNHLIAADGSNLFPKTFSSLYRHNAMVEQLADTEPLVENLFLWQRTHEDEITYVVGNHNTSRGGFGIPIDGYSEMTDEAAILKLAAKIDAMTGKDEDNDNN